MDKELNLVITLGKDFKLPSVNSMYKAGMKIIGGKHIPYIYKDSSIKRLEALVDDQLRAVDFTDHLGWLKETRQFSATNQYILKSNVHRRDVDNMTKAVIDFFTRFVRNELGIKTFDDALFSEMHLYKSVIPKAEHEYLCMRITPSLHNMNFSHIEKPERALIHYTGDSDWENSKFKKAMKEVGIKYQLFNTDKKIREYDTDILIVPAERSTDSSVVDIMEFIYEHKDHGYCFIGLLGNPTPELVERLNNLGGSTIRAMAIRDYTEVANFFK